MLNQIQATFLYVALMGCLIAAIGGFFYVSTIVALASSCRIVP